MEPSKRPACRPVIPYCSRARSTAQPRRSGLKKLPEAASFKTCFSSDSSANNRLSQVFSFSSSFGSKAEAEATTGEIYGRAASAPFVFKYRPNQVIIRWQKSTWLA